MRVLGDLNLLTWLFRLAVFEMTLRMEITSWIPAVARTTAMATATVMATSAAAAAAAASR